MLFCVNLLQWPAPNPFNVLRKHLFRCCIFWLVWDGVVRWMLGSQQTFMPCRLIGYSTEVLEVFGTIPYSVLKVMNPLCKQIRSAVMHCLTTGIHSEKCVVRWFRRFANVIECTYANLETWHWLGLLMPESPFRHPFSELLWQVIFLHNQLI